MEVGFPIFFGVVTTMVVIPNLLINCVPAADTPLTNASMPSHCSPLKIFLPSSALETGSSGVKRYEHLDSVLISNVSGADGSRRECQFVCLYGQWTGPLCRRMDMLQNDRSSQNYQPVWQSCSFEPSEYVNVSIFYNGINISEATGEESDGWPGRMTVFPHGGRLMLRCKDVGEFIFHGPPVLMCQNGQWVPVTLRAGSGEKVPFARPTCERISESDSIVEEKILYPPIITAVTYAGTVAPFYDGRLFVYPGSDLNLGLTMKPGRAWGSNPDYWNKTGIMKIS